MVGAIGFEPMTLYTSSKCSTTELSARIFIMLKSIDYFYTL